jgi:hypothetical protein
MPKLFPDKGKGPFDEMSSPLNAQVPAKDPRKAVAPNKALEVEPPKDPLGYIPGK